MTKLIVGSRNFANVTNNGEHRNRSIKILSFHVQVFTGNDFLLRIPVVPLVDNIASRERGGRSCLRRGVINEENKT
jgi:hypothetical protein